MNDKCKCGSFTINHHKHGRDGSDGDLCDVCYWRKRADKLTAQLRVEGEVGVLHGMIEGITLYAIWKDGEQKVGCLEKPLKEVLKPYLDKLKQLAQEEGK